MLTQEQYDRLCRDQAFYGPDVADLLESFEALHAALEEAVLRGHPRISAFDALNNEAGETRVVLQSVADARSASKNYVQYG